MILSSFSELPGKQITCTRAISWPWWGICVSPGVNGCSSLLSTDLFIAVNRNYLSPLFPGAELWLAALMAG